MASNHETPTKEATKSQEVKTLAESPEVKELDSRPNKEKSSPPEALYAPPKKKSKWVKYGKVVAVIGIVVGAGAVFLSGKLQEVNQQFLSQAYLSANAQMRDVTVSVSSTGTVTPVDSFNVTTLTTGDILSAPFEEGDIVEKGEMLYVFDSSSVENSILQAQLTLERSQLAYEQTLETLTPYATGSGYIQKVYVEEGQSVTSGTVLVDISDNSRQKIEIPFHTSQVSQFTVGQSATLTLDQTMEELKGTITYISPLDEVGAGNVILRQVEISLANPGAVTTATSATARVETSSGTVYAAGSGTFAQNLTHSILATSSGEIHNLFVKQGQYVSYGDSIAVIGGSAAENSLANALNTLESSRLSLLNTQDSLDNYTVTAPISGTVIEKKFKEGDKLDSTSLSAAGGNMAIIYDMSKLTFEMSIHELDINKIDVGQRVEITADAVEGAEFTGYVDKININGSTAGGMTTYPITVVIDDPEGLKPGMNVSAEVIMEAVGEVLTVPLEAVSRGSSGATVIVALDGALNEAGQVQNLDLTQEVSVELGINDSSYIQIISGITEDDILIWENDVVDMFTNMMMAGPGGR
ncbi:MAG: efflux RND transporter periplasmic adaptor subunit [Eubacteriales bacterium]